MAHDPKLRAKLRTAYVTDRLSMELACTKCKLPRPTANRWKKEARDAGDDWDNARAAGSLSDSSFQQAAVKLLNDYIAAHQVTMDMLRETRDITPIERADALASLSDSFNKTMSSFKKLMPEIDQRAVALDVLRRLAQFVTQHHPAHANALLAVLEPFGEEISRTLK